MLISATALPPWRTLGLGVLAILCATALAVVHRPLPWIPGETLQFPFLYVIGIWAAVLLGIAFSAVYAWRVAEEARVLAEALAATELVLAREQHLSQLDGLAAAAAHELGTPLATIALVVKEIERLADKDGPFADDIVLLREQVERCRNILSTLTSLSDEEVGPLDRLTLSHLVEEVAAPHRVLGVPIEVAKQRRGRRAGLPPQSGPHLQSRQHRRQRRRFRGRNGARRAALERRHGRARGARRRRWASRPK